MDEEKKRIRRRRGGKKKSGGSREEGGGGGGGGDSTAGRVKYLDLLLLDSELTLSTFKLAILLGNLVVGQGELARLHVRLALQLGVHLTKLHAILNLLLQLLAVPATPDRCGNAKERTREKANGCTC